MLKLMVILVLPFMRARVDFCLLKSISTKPHCYEFFTNIITRIYPPQKTLRSWSPGYCVSVMVMVLPWLLSLSIVPMTQYI